MHKKITALMLALLLVLSLVGCGKIRTPDNYYIDQYENGWSILYKDEDGEVEEIAALGSYAQPLVLLKSRLYFIHDGALVSVDSDGEDRKRLPITGIDGGFIAYIDETAVYCVTDPTAKICHKVDLELTASEEMPIPRKFRQADYAALKTAIETAVAASENDIRIRSAYLTLDGNGSLAAMELDVLAFRGWTGSMKVWGNGTVRIQMTTADPAVQYTDLHIPLSLSDDTTSIVMPLDAFMLAAETVDKAGVAAAKGSADAKGYALSYLQDEYESNLGSAPWLGVSGIDASADSSVPHFVLAQLGSANASMTDNHKNSCSILAALRFDL